MQESLQDLQHQINQIKDSNRRFEQEIENQGKEGMLNDRFLAQGNISGYQCEVPSYKVDYARPELNKPRMMTVR